jgi:hypothetical protein
MAPRAPVEAGEACDLLISIPIVTGIAKGVYQNHGYMNVTPTPKISLANKANLINQVAAPTKAVNQKPSTEVPHAIPKGLRDPSRL